MLAFDFRATLPLLAALAVIVGSFGFLAHVDDRAGEARARESRGLTRGPILDRNGRPLAFTVNIANGSVRRYPVPSAQPVVGYRDPSGRWHGLEARFDAFLAGTADRTGWNAFFQHLQGRAIQGGRLRLTIDSKLQATADAALGRSRGAIVAIEPRTGDVLALVTKPYCSSAVLVQTRAVRTCRHDPRRPLEDRATQLLVPPGSAFKIVTFSAAMDTRRFSLNSVFTGADAFGPSPYFDNEAYPSNITFGDMTRVSILRALAFSDNFVFAHIGLTLGGSTLLKYAHRYRLGRRIPFELPVASSVIADGRSHPSLAEVAQSSFGGEVDKVTPLQMALIAATVANRGVMMAPHLVEDFEDASGRQVRRYRDHSLGRVMSARAARDVTTGMIYVVEHGSGFKSQILGIKVAGKTGTAQAHAFYPHAWFIAFAPAHNPVVAVAVLREYAGEGFEFAAPLARRVLVTALRERGYKVR
jgi:peptidoglycan glycosyltransferase